MKVISGVLKGRIIEGYVLSNTRPTMDRVKESLFGSIQNYVKNSISLDLFAGSGNLGIEAISNGGEKSYFVDKDKLAYKTIRKNISNFNINDKAIVLNKDYKEALKYLANNNFTFDIIFLDPPYKTNYIEESLKLIDKYDLVNEESIIVCESDSLDKIIYSSKFKELKSKKYGDKYIVILQLA